MKWMGDSKILNRKEEEMEECIEVLEEAVMEGLIVCRRCGSLLEPDAEKCDECGWINPVVAEGWI